MFKAAGHHRRCACCSRRRPARCCAGAAGPPPERRPRRHRRPRPRSAATTGPATTADRRPRSRRPRPPTGSRRRGAPPRLTARAARCWPRSCCSSPCSAPGRLRYDGFFSGQVLLNLFIDNAYLIVLAVGMTFVILTGGIDLSVGSVVALSGVLAAKPCCARLDRRCGDGRWCCSSAPSLGPRDGAGDPLPRDAAVHRHAGRACSWPAGLCYVISVESIPIRDPLFTADRPGHACRCPATRSSARRSWSRCWSWRSALYVLHATRFGRTRLRRRRQPAVGRC